MTVSWTVTEDIIICTYSYLRSVYRGPNYLLYRRQAHEFSSIHVELSFYPNAQYMNVKRPLSLMFSRSFSSICRLWTLCNVISRKCLALFQFQYKLMQGPGFECYVSQKRSSVSMCVCLCDRLFILNNGWMLLCMFLAISLLDVQYTRVCS